MTTAWMGIDPGRTGGIALISDGGVYAWEMPDLGGWLDLHMLLKECREKADTVYVLIEQVHALPTDSAKAAFTFGMTVGAAEALVTALGMRLWRVTSKRWRNMVGLSVYMHGSTPRQRRQRLKQKALEMAKMLYPDAVVHRRWTDGVAEALLLATACWQMWGSGDEEARE